MKTNGFALIVVLFVLLASTACGISQVQPTPVPTNTPLPTTIPPTSIPMPTATPEPPPDTQHLVEVLLSLGFTETNTLAASTLCPQATDCRDFMNWPSANQTVQGVAMFVRINNDTSNIGIARIFGDLQDSTGQTATLTTILQAIGLSDTEIEWVNSHAESALAGTTEVGNFNDFTITELFVSGSSATPVWTLGIGIEHVN